ncbi:hypothetical protein SBY92_001794 [Candida maltosa Xu316]
MPSVPDNSYRKVLNSDLTIILKYLERESSQQECILSFINTSKTTDIKINPIKQQQQQQNGGGWFGSFLGSTSSIDESKVSLNDESDDMLHLFLGYIQLFGYVVLNYKFSIDTSSLEINKGNQWWNNTEYLNQYLHKDDPSHDTTDEHWKLDTVPFIEKNQHEKLTIGGKLGGVNDLIVKDEKITTTKGHLLHDLINTFDSGSFAKHSPLAPLSLHDLTDPIIPIYTTSQSLLFTDLTIPRKSSREFHIKFPIKKNLPPSYNTNSTGPACDQGLVSIRYALVVSLVEDMLTNKSQSIYFPLQIYPERYGITKYLQKKYFDDLIELDKDWKIETVSVNEEAKPDTRDVMGRDTFLQDLSKLIDSDLYNMPKISTMERRKSSINGANDEVNPEGYILQLPQHMKTQYKLRVNNQELCLIGFPRPFYHPGDDINYIINIKNDSTTKVIGLITYLEAHEVFHLREKEEEKEQAKQVNKYKVTGNIKLNTFSPSVTKSSHGKCLVNDYINIPKHLSPQFQSSSFLNLEYHLVFQFNLAEIGQPEEQQETEVEAQGDLFNQSGKYKFETLASSYRFTVPIYILPQ